jgi:hypothetical protein
VINPVDKQQASRKEESKWYQLFKYLLSACFGAVAAIAVDSYRNVHIDRPEYERRTRRQERTELVKAIISELDNCQRGMTSFFYYVGVFNKQAFKTSRKSKLDFSAHQDSARIHCTMSTLRSSSTEARMRNLSNQTLAESIRRYPFQVVGIYHHSASDNMDALQDEIAAAMFEGGRLAEILIDYRDP